MKEHLGQVVENVSQVINIWDKNLCSESQKAVCLHFPGGPYIVIDSSNIY